MEYLADRDAGISTPAAGQKVIIPYIHPPITLGEDGVRHWAEHAEQFPGSLGAGPHSGTIKATWEFQEVEQGEIEGN